MQIDCHYYGTYYIARKVGFNHDEAQKIAWAAQSVDEMNHSVVREQRDKAVNLMKSNNKSKNEESLKQEYTEKYYNVVTTHEFGFYLFQKEMTRQDSLSQLSKQIESVWSVFHFMPSGATKEELNAKNRDVDLEKIKNGECSSDFAKKKYERDLKLVCKPSSRLANQIFKYVLDIVKEHSEFNDEILYTIGIFMHVIADTWSHQDYCGSNDMLVNHGFIVEKEKKFSYKPNLGKIALGEIAWSSEISLEDLEIDSVFRCFSAIWTGHGPSGTYPDIPGKTYTYIPDYTNTPITVNNPNDRYKKAFAQMYYIMTAFREKYDYEIISNVEIPEIVEDITCFTETEDTQKRCNLWKDFLKNELKDYDINDGENNILIFLSRAHDYRNYVLDKIANDILNEKNYYKDVEKLTIKELMSSKFEDALKAFETALQFVAENTLEPVVQVVDEKKQIAGQKIDQVEEKWNAGMLNFFDQIFSYWDLWNLVRR